MSFVLQLGEFRQAAEDRHTHLYQNPWYPAPESKTGDKSASKAKASFIVPSVAVARTVDHEGSVQR